MRQHRPSLPFRRTRRARSAFTLVELLVVIGILLIISAMTLSVINLSISGDRIRGSARQVQSMLEGARSHAIYGGKNKKSSFEQATKNEAKQRNNNDPSYQLIQYQQRHQEYQAGVRFIIDTQVWKPNQAYRAGDRVIPSAGGTGFSYRVTAPAAGGTSGTGEPTWPTALGGTIVDNGITWTAVSDAVLVTSMQFVEIDPENAFYDRGVFGIKYDGSNNATILEGTTGTNSQADTRWLEAYDQGLIVDFQTIVLENRRYQLRTTNLRAGIEQILLVTPYMGPKPFAAPGDTNGFAVPKQSQPDYRIVFPPQPMANQEPRLLSNGVALDLSVSKGLGYYVSNSLPIDIMFSPRGSVVGPLSGTGIVQLVVSDRGDSLTSAPLAWRRWQASTAYPAGAYVVAITGEMKSVFRANAAGTTGGTEPAWNNTLGGSTTDGGVTWTALGAPKKERMIVSLTPQTGKAAVHPIYLDPFGATEDPYRYAETGEVARQ